MTAPQNPIVDGLQQVLAAQHACVYGYPALGTRLEADAQITQARTDEADHRLARDTVSAQLVRLGAAPAAAEPSYAPPAPLLSPVAAQRWAVALEERAATAYRYLLLCSVQAGGAQPALRKQAMAGLSAAAQTAAHWRGLITPDKPTVAFPGS